MFVEAPDAARGPYTSEDLLDMYGRGEISGATRVHCDGKWRPYRLINLDAGSDHKTATIWLWLLIVVALATSILFVASMLPEFTGHTDRGLDLPATLVVTVPLLLLAIVSLAVSRKPEAYAQATVLATVVSGITLLFFAQENKFNRADEMFGKHSIERVSDSTIRLTGGVGRTLALDLRQIMGSMPGIVTVELDNSGGSIDAALESATYLRDRGRVVTRVTGNCSSACVAIFAAGSSRQMLPGSTLGVHQVTMIFGGGDQAVREEARYFSWLHERGINDAIIAAGKKTKANTLTKFIASKDDAALTGIDVTDRRGKILSLAEQGIWLAAEREGDVGKSLLAAVNQAMPDLREKYGKSLREELMSVDDAAYRATSESLAIEAGTRSVTFANGAEAARYLKTLQNPEICEGKPLVDAKNKQILAALGVLLDSAKANNYQYAAASSDRVWNQFLDIVRSEQLSKKRESGSEEIKECLMSQHIISALGKMPSSEVPGIYRRVLDDA